MKFDIKGAGWAGAGYMTVSVSEGSSKIDMGLFSREELEDLAQTLIAAAYEMGPIGLQHCNEWMARMIEQATGQTIDALKGE